MIFIFCFKLFSQNLTKRLGPRRKQGGTCFAKGLLFAGENKNLTIMTKKSFFRQWHQRWPAVESKLSGKVLSWVQVPFLLPSLSSSSSSRVLSCLLVWMIISALKIAKWECRKTFIMFCSSEGQEERRVVFCGIGHLQGWGDVTFDNVDGFYW